VGFKTVEPVEFRSVKSVQFAFCYALKSDDTSDKAVLNKKHGLLMRDKLGKEGSNTPGLEEFTESIPDQD
jgi:hypothetical protein